MTPKQRLDQISFEQLARIRRHIETIQLTKQERASLDALDAFPEIDWSLTRYTRELIDQVASRIEWWRE